MKTASNLLIIIGILLIAVNAGAEVMDKEPSLYNNLIFGLLCGVIWFFAFRFRLFLLVFLVPISALYFVALIIEIRDPYVGSAIIHEAGIIYIYSVYSIVIFLIFCAISGFLLRRKAIQYSLDTKKYE